jgi:hypothetical protein
MRFLPFGGLMTSPDSSALVFQSLCIGSMPKRCPYRKYEENLDENIEELVTQTVNEDR